MPLLVKITAVNSFVKIVMCLNHKDKLQMLDRFGMSAVCDGRHVFLFCMVWLSY